MSLKQNIKARLNAKKYNIWTEEIDPKREADTWLSGYWYADNQIYYGHPFFIFFKSSQIEFKKLFKD